MGSIEAKIQVAEVSYTALRACRDLPSTGLDSSSVLSWESTSGAAGARSPNSEISNSSLDACFAY